MRCGRNCLPGNLLLWAARRNVRAQRDHNEALHRVFALLMAGCAASVARRDELAVMRFTSGYVVSTAA
jgi:hypothetical protein